MTIETQRREFDAVAELATAYRRLPQIVDDDYPEMRHYYERAMRHLIVAMRDNLRTLPLMEVRTNHRDKPRRQVGETYEDFIVRLLETIMAQVDDLTADLAKLTADYNTLATNVTTGTAAQAAQIQTLQTELAAAQATIAAGGAPDLTAAIAAVTALDTSVNTLNTAVSPPAPTPPPATGG